MIYQLIRFILEHLFFGHQNSKWQGVREALQVAPQPSKCIDKARRILRTIASGVPRYVAVEFTVSKFPLPSVGPRHKTAHEPVAVLC